MMFDVMFSTQNAKIVANIQMDIVTIGKEWDIAPILNILIS